LGFESLVFGAAQGFRNRARVSISFGVFPAIRYSSRLTYLALVHPFTALACTTLRAMDFDFSNYCVPETDTPHIGTVLSLSFGELRGGERFAVEGGFYADRKMEGVTVF